MITAQETIKAPVPSTDYLTELLGCQPEDILFIDIETTGLSPKTTSLYLIGMVYFEGGSWNIRQLFAETPEQEESLLTGLSEMLEGYSAVSHFNGDRFDIPFLQYKYEEKGLPNPFEQKKSLDIYRLVKPYKLQLGLPDCKQTSIEKFLGIDREDQYNGQKLIKVYQDYTVTGDPEELRLLMLHNNEDLKGMLHILPILKYTKFFNLFRNLPAVSVRTDEEISESRYTDSPLPVKAVKVQANYYKEQDGSEKKEVYMKLTLPVELPSPLSGNRQCCFFRASGTEATLRVPLFEEELKYFYSNYKDYYYLPHEDMAVHKSIGEFVDKDFREKARPENCYTKKAGQYLMQWDLVFSPFFKRDYEDKNFFFDLNENMKQSRFAMSLYAAHVIANILDF